MVVSDGMYSFKGLQADLKAPPTPLPGKHKKKGNIKRNTQQTTQRKHKKKGNTTNRKHVKQYIQPKLRCHHAHAKPTYMESQLLTQPDYRDTVNTITVQYYQ